MADVTSKHPDLFEFTELWKALRDFYEGPRKVKAAGTTYLPPTAGMVLDGALGSDPKAKGAIDYAAYKQRARVPDYIREAVETLVGLMHQKPAIIELPPELEYLRTNASVNHESLNQLYQRINSEQILTGRLGLLADLSDKAVGAKPELRVAFYQAETIINWNDNWVENEDGKLQMVVLDESGPQQVNMFDWEVIEQYRVCMLDESKDKPGTTEYKFGVYNIETGFSYNEENMKTALVVGKPSDSIPFVFINAINTRSDIDSPPLSGLCDICIGIYQSEADYRQNLYMQSQETLVVKGSIRNPDGEPGSPEALRTGAGARIDVDMTGDAKYIGVSANGLSEQRTAIENERKMAATKSGQLIQNDGSQMESGEALSTRFNAQSATLNQIANTAAAGLTSLLKIMARWVGANPDSVKVTPNLEFVNFKLDGDNFLKIMEARKSGLPISLESIHATLADRGLTVFDFLTEVKKIADENAKYKDLLPSDEPKTPASPASQKNVPAA